MSSRWLLSHVMVALLCWVTASADSGKKSGPAEAKTPRPEVAIAARTNTLGDGGRVGYVPLLAHLVGEDGAWRDTMLAEPSPQANAEYESMRERLSRKLDGLAFVGKGLETQVQYEARRKNAENAFFGRFASLAGQVDTIGALPIFLQEYDPETELALVSVLGEEPPVKMADCVSCSDQGDTTGFSRLSRTAWLAGAIFARLEIPREVLREVFPGDDWKIPGVAIPRWTARIQLSWSLISKRMPRTVAEMRARKPEVFKNVEGLCCRVSEFTILNASGETVSSMKAECR